MTGMHEETELGEAWWQWRVWRGLAGDLSHTRALLQATIACVVIVLKAWRPGPEPPPRRLLCMGAAAFTSRVFPPSCGLLDVFVLRAKVNLNRKKKEKLHGTVHVWPLPTPPPFHLFYFLVFYVLAACSVIRKFKNWQHWGIYILTNFSNGFLTRKHILQFLSILVFLRLSVAVPLTTSPGLLQIILLHKSSPGPSIFLFSLHSVYVLIQRLLPDAQLLSWTQLLNTKGLKALMNLFNRTVRSKFPNCAAEICLISAQGERRRNRKQKHNPQLT